METIDFSLALKQARATTGMTQKALSEAMEIPYNTYQRWELGDREPPMWQQKMILREISRQEAITKGYKFVRVRRK